ncbi:polysaccharide biosynthesis protein, partial [Acinetobacter baumannii]|nr:polysaccharide biosynthesis protein [Acinetobacter baumannii]
LQTGEERKRIAIYGAGDAGQQIAAVLYRSGNHLPVFFIDDNTSLQDPMVGGLKVLSLEKALQRFEKYKPDEILLALPSVGRVR